MIEFHSVSKRYGALQVIHDVSATVEKGTTIVLCGPSGSGKSTLVRTVNRLEPIQSGRITVAGRDIHEKSVDVNTLRSGIGFVFQQFNLFPHLTVVDNVMLPLRRLRGQSRRQALPTAMLMLERVGLADRAQSLPADISGGQAQRVAIARSLILKPEILILDEPTSALDPEMVGEVLKLLRELSAGGITLMCVTHEMGFAREVADRIWFLKSGRLTFDASPDLFFSQEAHPDVRGFLSSIHRNH
ncbi:polar amino acid transport system ATP-binding protein [Rhizobium sp. PP-F2F-G38]|uniref:Amino acid ABC transporter ATP-binding protein n=1 Tax=Ferranicluibacter rubi TaxID=2715133 RepID=A0AA43ZD97_9HYPH|nr:amino acid ABC transporter ATP-binding protein [Ferranicluibacter rubi]PYE32633.1 polar amino acid transport system ATP-binding protein [Rhizobium sp. PP-WC-1G-195]PYE96062.1 polar amino acid transport system ATP-binding protein [Rhizobium sp. PP-F2F-G38]TCP88333.1 polar amino acid transport system ATP-binding protein [Rhizobium sp. PP-CC-2G-626]TCQ23002.1 polar amino acid transport system ATP-binding protein [Rhizobium sp. PP-CC-3G-465]NHT75688.1 amino acid ABC transporter ATP-binding prot